MSDCILYSFATSIQSFEIENVMTLNFNRMNKIVNFCSKPRLWCVSVFVCVIGFALSTESRISVMIIFMIINR